MNLKTITIGSFLSLFTYFSYGQTNVSSQIESGTIQNFPCSNYSEYSKFMINGYLTKSHLALERRQAGTDGLTIQMVSPVSNSSACQNLRNLISSRSEFENHTSDWAKNQRTWTPHFYQAEGFYFVVYQPDRLISTMYTKIYIVNSNFELVNSISL